MIVSTSTNYINKLCLKPKMDKKEIALLTFLFLFSLYFWTLPFANNQLPFSEVDGGHHFALADYMSSHDKVIDSYPYYYYKYNVTALTPSGVMMHTPPFFVNNAIAQIIGGDRVLSFWLMMTFMNLAFVFGLYFLMRMLYGLWIAFFTALLGVFSGVDLFTHIMGQWPAQIAFALTPVILYCYYKYTKSCLEKEPKAIYLWLIPFLLLAQTAHFQALAHSGLAIIIYSLFIAIKEKKLFFNYKHLLIAVLLIFVLLGPLLARPLAYYTTYVGGEGGEEVVKYDGSPRQISAFFDWYSDKVRTNVFPQQFFSYSFTNGWWTLPFFFAGLIFILYRREKKDLLLLSWLLTVYLILHLDIIVGGDFAYKRIARSIIDLPHVIYPIIIIGVFFAFSGLKKITSPRNVTLITGIFILIMLAVFNYANVSPLIKEAYPQPLRINSGQYQASEWLRANTELNDNIMVYGTFYDKVARWMRSISQRNVYQNQEKKAWERYYGNLTEDYVMIDYTDAALTGNQQLANQLGALEQNYQNYPKVYGNNGISIYKMNQIGQEGAVKVD